MPDGRRFPVDPAESVNTDGTEEGRRIGSVRLRGSPSPGAGSAIPVDVAADAAALLSC